MLIFRPLKDWLARQTILHELPYWIAALSVGVVAVAYANLFHAAEVFSQRFMSTHPYVFLAAAPLLFFLGWALVYFLAPEAKGSGIPQVMAAIQKVEAHDEENGIARLLSVRTLIVKIMSSSCCLLGGGAIGREGPTIQIAAGIFYLVSKRFKNISRKKLNVEFWLVTGGAAGIAAAFNTPLGGLVYAIEELATSHFNKFKTSLIAAVIISGLASQWFQGPYLYLGFPKLLPFTFSIIPWAILVGAGCGLAGALFGKLLYSFSMKMRSIKSWSWLGLIAGACGLSVALMGLFVNSAAIGSGKEAITDLLFSRSNDFDWTLSVVRFVGPIVTYVAGTAGGIFAPSLAAGGSLGYGLGQLVNTPHSNLFVLLGMIAFLTGVTRTPFTSFVLVLEMTDRHSAIFPMMLAALVSAQLARWVQVRSVYELLRESY